MNDATAKLISEATAERIFDFFLETGRIFGTVDQSLHFIAEEFGEACRAWNAMSDTPFVRNHPEKNVKDVDDFLEELGDVIMMAMVTSMIVVEDASGKNALDALFLKIDRKISEASATAVDSPVICDGCVWSQGARCSCEEIERAKRSSLCVGYQKRGSWLNPNEWDTAKEQDAAEKDNVEHAFLMEQLKEIRRKVEAQLEQDEDDFYCGVCTLESECGKADDAACSEPDFDKELYRKSDDDEIYREDDDEMFDHCECWFCRSERGEPVELVTTTLMTSEQIKSALDEIGESDRFIRLHSTLYDDDSLTGADFAVRNASA